MVYTSALQVVLAGEPEEKDFRRILGRGDSVMSAGSLIELSRLAGLRLGRDGTDVVEQLLAL